MNERDTKFFKPLWRRLAVMALCFVWIGWEFTNGVTLWLLLAGALTLYSFWTLFLNFDRPGRGK